jgi:hypothetical protein
MIFVGLAVFHAKAVIADDEAVFVTSKNLTEDALDRNIELWRSYSRPICPDHWRLLS